MPLATVDDVRDELARTGDAIRRLLDLGTVVDEGRRDERLAILRDWHSRLTGQLAAMEAAA